MVGKPKKTKRKISIPIEKQKTNEKKRKMSVPIEKAETNKEKRSSKKISVPIENPEISEKRGLKISTPKTVSVHQPVERLDEIGRIEELPESTNIELSVENIANSTSKVEDWLKTVSPENTVEQENIPPKEDTPPGQTPSVLDDLEDVANWLERHKGTKPTEKQQSGFLFSGQRSKSSWKTESLVQLLEKETPQPEAPKVNKDTEETNNEDVDSDKKNLESPCSSSDLPLSKLALKEKAGRKSTDGASKPSPDLSSQPPLNVTPPPPLDVTPPPLDVIPPPLDVIPPPLDVTPPPLLDAILPPPKENLELSVVVDKAEEKKDKRDHSSRSTTYESVSMDIIRDVDENEDIVSHFPQPIMAEVTVVEFGSFSSDSNSIEYLIDRKNVMKNRKNKKIISVDKNVTNNVENKDINSTVNETKEQNFTTNEHNTENFEDHTSEKNSVEKNIINNIKDKDLNFAEKSIAYTVEDIVKEKNSATDANTKDKNFANYSSGSSSTGKNIKSAKKKNLRSPRNELKESNFANNKDEEKIQIANESHDKSLNTSARKRKRPLYNPGDYSYLSENIVEEYLPPETVNASINHVTKRPRGRPKKSSTKENQKPSKYQRKSIRSKRQTKTLCCTPKNSTEITTSLTLDKAFASLKRKIKEEKRMGKVQKKVERVCKGRKNGMRVEVSSPSSPSSLEPFGKIVNKRNNKVNEKVQKFNNSKRQKTETTCKKTVNIISNILVKPAVDTFAASPVPSDTENYKKQKPCFCRTYVKLLQRNFQELMIHVQHCDLDVFNKKKLSAVQNLLEELQITA